MNKLKGQKIVSCRICKGDHWTTRCPYKDTLGPMQKELAEQLGLSTGEKEKLPGGARTLGYGWQAWGLRGGVGVEHRNCVRLWESWVLTWGLDRTTTVGGYYLPHSSKAVATAHVGLCERLQVGALLVAPPVSLSGFVRASSEHCCRCKDIASSEGRRLFSQCVCPDWSLLCLRTCACARTHTHTHTHSLSLSVSVLTGACCVGARVHTHTHTHTHWSSILVTRVRSHLSPVPGTGTWGLLLPCVLSWCV